MSERKVLNKYFPPDFDPSKIPRKKVGKDVQITVRLMAPFTMCCKTCGEFVYKGKKFNAKKETALGEEYYGIKIFRFYIKCTRCSAEITFKTDPKNADYICEHGATRNFEPTTTAASQMPTAADDDEDEGSDAEDPMKALEESQAASKRQMEEEDALADLRQRNARMERSERETEEILKAQHAAKDRAAEERRKRELDEEDEEVNKFFYKVQAPAGTSTNKAKDRTGDDAGLMGGYGSGSEDEDRDEDEQDPSAEPSTITVKRRPLGATAAEPTVQELLAARGVALKVQAPAGTSTNKAKDRTGDDAGLMGGYGSGSEDEDRDEDEQDPSAEPSTITVKRRPLGATAAEPTVQELLAARGVALSSGPASNIPNKAFVVPGPGVKAPAGVKRKGVGALGIKLVKKTKV